MCEYAPNAIESARSIRTTKYTYQVFEVTGRRMLHLRADDVVLRLLLVIIFATSCSNYTVDVEFNEADRLRDGVNICSGVGPLEDELVG